MNTLKQNAILVPTCLAIASIIYYLNESKPNKCQEIPYPPSVNWPIFGHMLSLGDNPAKQITKWHKETGPIFKINMGNQLWILVNDPYLAYDIFVKHGSKTSSRPYHRYNMEISTKNHPTKGLPFVENSREWRTMKNIAFALFGQESVKKYKDILESESDALMSRFEGYTDAFNPYQELLLTSLNIVLIVLASKRVDTTKEPEFNVLSDILEHSVIYAGITGDLLSFVPSMGWIDLIKGTEKKLKDFVELVRDPMYTKIIEDARKGPEDSFVKDLYEMKERGIIDEQDIHIFMSDMVPAASDPVANALYWTMAILSQNQNVQDNLIKELDCWKANHPPGCVPSFDDDRDDFHYMICVQKEILRFRPGTYFGLPHLATQDITVNGYFIPKGASIASSMLSMHHDSGFYENAHKFIPERFTKNTTRMRVTAKAKMEGKDHFGFGWGRRLCPGIHLTEVQLFNFYVRFFSKFIVAPELDSKGLPVPIDLNAVDKGGIISKAAPYKIRVLPRTL